MQLSSFEKAIYNEYLRAKRRGKPYTPRKDFRDLDAKTYTSLNKVASFLTTYNHIRPRDFFDAGFADNEYATLDFFFSMRAVKLYKMYFETQLNKADAEWTIDFLKESFLFILRFCKENNISVDDYIEMESPGGIPWFIIHLKNFNICIYLLFAFDTFENKLIQHSYEVTQMLSDEFIKGLPQHRMNFIRSERCKKIAREGLLLCRKQTRTKQLEHT